MAQTEAQIEFADALRVLWKYKFMILAGTLICIICVGIVSLVQPEIYRVDMIILPGKISHPKTMKLDYIDSPHNIRAIIQQKILRKRIQNNLKRQKTTNSAMNLNFKIFIPRKTDIIKVSYETQNINDGIAALNALATALNKYYADSRELYFSDWNERLNQLNSLVSIKNIEEPALEKRVQTLQAMVDRTMKQFDEAAVRTDGKSLDATQEQNIQNIALIRLLDEARVDLARVREEKKLNLDEIAMIKRKKNDSKYIQILKSPKATQKPIRPRLKINLAIALIGGVLLMILLSFCIEYIRNLIKGTSKTADIQTTKEK